MISEYSEKLRDPRWQKKRLQILERDEWACQRCGDTNSTLVVHHRRYLPDKEPWDYPDELLITLCKECHEYEKENTPIVDHDLLAMLHTLFLSDDIYSLSVGFHQMELQHSHEIVASAYEMALSSPYIQKGLIEKLFTSFKSNVKEKISG